MKKILCLLTTLTLFGCSSQTITPNETVSPTTEPTIDIVATDVPTESLIPTEVTSNELPLVTVGIFNNTDNPDEYCIVTVNINQGDNYNSIDMQPMYDFVNTHTDLIESYGYDKKYEDVDGEMLSAMGFTPQSLRGYNIDYYYYYYNIDPSVIDEFLEAVHSAPAKFGTRIEEGDPIEVTYVEDTIEFKPTTIGTYEMIPLTLAFNQDGWDYYMVNKAENLYIKVVDTIDYDVFTIGQFGNLYGMFYQGDVSVDCLYGWFVSDSAFTSHGESGGFSGMTQQPSENLRVQPFMIHGLPMVTDQTINHAVNSFASDNIQLEVVE